MSLTEPAAQGTDVVMEVVPSGLRPTTLREKVCLGMYVELDDGEQIRWGERHGGKASLGASNAGAAML